MALTQSFVKLNLGDKIPVFLCKRLMDGDRNDTGFILSGGTMFSFVAGRKKKESNKWDNYLIDKRDSTN
jgi:hypothetical protein